MRKITQRPSHPCSLPRECRGRCHPGLFARASRSSRSASSIGSHDLASRRRAPAGASRGLRSKQLPCHCRPALRVRIRPGPRQGCARVPGCARALCGSSWPWDLGGGGVGAPHLVHPRKNFLAAVLRCAARGRSAWAARRRPSSWGSGPATEEAMARWKIATRLEDELARRRQYRALSSKGTRTTLRVGRHPQGSSEPCWSGFIRLRRCST
jgi:hypothetical protein